MARLLVILSVFSSLFLLSLARHPIDLETKPETQVETLLPEESNTTVATLDPNESTVLEILDANKRVEEEKDTQVSNLALPDESAEQGVVVESDPGMIIAEVIGWQPREEEEKKKEVVRKKKGKKLDESDSDSDSDSDDEEEEEERKKRERKRGKKLGFWRRLLKLISPFN